MLETAILFVILLLLSAFFSCAESAVLSVSKLRLKRLLRQKRRNAHILAKLKEDPHRLLDTILIGNNLANIGAASLATAMAIQYFGSTGIGIATGVTTLLVLFFSEIIPKSLGVSHASAISLLFAPPLYALQWLLTPVVFVIDRAARVFTRLFGEPEKEAVTEEEVREVLRASEHDGHLKSREREMIQNVLKLDDRSADEAMTPRLDVFCLEMHKKVSEVIDTMIAEGYSRVPVYDTRMDQMRGVVIVKELLLALKEGKTGVTLEEVMQPILFVPENKKLDALLREFQRRKAAMGIVVDEHGLFIGIITIEDILEELVGEIYDENDVHELEEVRKLDGRTYLISGKTLIAELNERLGFAIPEEEDYDTLAGFLMDRFGRIPKPGEETLVGRLRLLAEKVTQHRIVTVRAVVDEPKAAKPKKP
jgi:CBS domain containing-hemolysin-like protein